MDARSDQDRIVPQINVAHVDASPKFHTSPYCPETGCSTLGCRKWVAETTPNLVMKAKTFADTLSDYEFMPS